MKMIWYLGSDLGWEKSVMFQTITLNTQMCLQNFLFKILRDLNHLNMSPDENDQSILIETLSCNL